MKAGHCPAFLYLQYRRNNMSMGWVIFIIVLVLAIIVSNIILLKQSANMKIPDSVVEAMQKKKDREEAEQKQLEIEQKKNDKPD